MQILANQIWRETIHFGDTVTATPIMLTSCTTVGCSEEIRNRVRLASMLYANERGDGLRPIAPHSVTIITIQLEIVGVLWTCFQHPHSTPQKELKPNRVKIQ